MRKLPWLPALVLLAAARPAAAGVSELKLGVLAHDAGIVTLQREEGVDINGEVLFDSPDFLAAIWAPRPHVGVSVNTVGDTSQLYAGLTWTIDVPWGFFFDLSLGGSVHDGKLSTRDPERKQLGSRVLFRESISVGYRFDEHNSLSVFLDHISNANLASHNAGLDTLGMRWGYRF